MKPFLDPQVKALIEVGFVRAVDLLLLLCWLAIVVVFTWSWASGTLTTAQLVALIFLQTLVVGAWLVMLGYRVCYQTIMARSDINTMPEAAARLAISWHTRQ